MLFKLPALFLFAFTALAESSVIVRDSKMRERASLLVGGREKALETCTEILTGWGSPARTLRRSNQLRVWWRKMLRLGFQSLTSSLPFKRYSNSLL